MKEISLIYNHSMGSDVALVKMMESILQKKGFLVKKYDIVNSEQMNTFLLNTNPDNCQFVVGFNLAGYSLETTGGIASINHLPMNMIQYITKPIEEVDPLLQKTQSYMVKFIFSSETEAKKAKEKYQHIWNIGYCESIEAIIEEIENVDWRY